MCEKISKALRTHAEAIRNALATYNRLAASLIPPRSHLTWEQVMAMATLGEFDLLRDARQDVRLQPWAKPTHCDATNTYFNVKRAREELDRLNIEMNRLFSSMVDEHVDLGRAIAALRDEHPHLASELEECRRYWCAVNEKVVSWLLKTASLPGFTGTLAYGF
ncbi:hypothetical protein NUW54_g3170 [Trametes sanguinea]|uniref:Uncharacterized protein n=1 Tax=Trametes sanguinea TaxID=158606 RepID=A0ACC1Q2P8_9APHY|nr:hypothetical protein NUW54_g3170 [Trametes sanguinea]